MMMKRTLTFLLGVMCLLSAPAQSFDWLVTDGGSGSDVTKALATDGSGRVYVAIEASQGTLNLGGSIASVPAQGGLVLACLDSTGTGIWTRSYPADHATAYDLAYSTSGYLYLAMSYSGTIDFGNTTYNTSSPSSGMIVRVNANSGSLSWVRSIPGSSAVTGIDVNAQGDLWICGYYDSQFGPNFGPPLGMLPGSNGDIYGFVAQYSANNQPQWAKGLTANMGSSASAEVMPTAIAIDSSGMAHVTGRFQGIVDFPSASPSSFITNNPNNHPEMFLAGLTPPSAFNATPAFTYASQSFSTQGCLPTAIVADIDSFVYVAGTFRDSAGWVNAGLPFGGGIDYPFVLEASSGGGQIFNARGFPSSGVAADLAMNAQKDSLYVVGVLNGLTLDAGNGVTATAQGGAQHGFVVAMDRNLDPQWAGLMGGYTDSTQTYAVAANNYRPYVGGALSDSAKFGSFGFYVADGPRDCWVGRVGPDSPIIPPPPFPADSVWPGDANDDLIANNLDLLAVGLAYGQTGPTRPNASLLWQAQACYNWNDTLPGGVNLKHADTDGNGMIDAADTLAINLNYGLTHNKTEGTDTNAVGPLLYTSFAQDSLLAGDTATVFVNLGTAAQPADSIYGLAFELLFDTTLIDPNSVQVDFSQSWLGTKGSNLLTLDKVFPADGQIDLALTRNDQQHQNGQGELCRITIIMVDDLTAKDYLAEPFFVQIQNATVIDALGQEKPVELAADTLVVYQERSTRLQQELARRVHIAPNPSSGQIRMRLDGIRAQQVQVLDLQGRVIMTERGSFSEKMLDLSFLANGLYLLQVQTDQGMAQRRVVLQK